MISFVGLYRGRSVSDAQLIAVSTDADLVADVAARLLREGKRNLASEDAIIAGFERGRRAALRLVKKQAKEIRTLTVTSDKKGLAK